MATGAIQTGVSLSGEAWPRRVRLAQEPPFSVGHLTVQPSMRRVAHSDGREEIIEPRVMQVLVALFRARGAILSRDELTDWCWDGRIVGEDAINRVIARLRRLSETLGRDVFRIETVTKVGYRMALEEGVTGRASVDQAGNPAFDRPGEAHQDDRPGWGLRRRTMLGGGAAAVAAAAIPALWPIVRDAEWANPIGHRPTPEAKRFYDEGMKTQYHGFTATTDQAEAYFRQAAAADPQYADAWGSLAMSYRHMMDGETNVSQWRLVQQTRSAARRALTLDPGNEEALVALALLKSPYRRWRETEDQYLPLLRRFPEAFVLRGHLSRLYRDVGRFEDAVNHASIAIRQQPFVAYVSSGMVTAYWGAGRLHEAEAEMERAITRWPKFVPVWFQRFELLAYTGREEAAIAFASDREGRPTELPDFLFDRRISTARALQGRSQADIDRAVGDHMEFIRRSLAAPPHVLNAAFSVPFFAAIGDLDTAFEILEGFYFDRGRFAPPVRRSFGPLTRRESYFLFMPPAAPLRADARLAALLQEVGITDYRRSVGLAALP